MSEDEQCREYEEFHDSPLTAFDWAEQWIPGLARLSAEAGWDLDGPSVVRALAYAHIPTNPELLKEVEERGMFVLWETLWASEREAAGGEQ